MPADPGVDGTHDGVRHGRNGLPNLWNHPRQPGQGEGLGDDRARRRVTTR